MAHGKKTGGRVKGTPNKTKSAFRTQLRAYCASLGVDPHRFMAEMMADTSTGVLGVALDGAPILGPAVALALKFQAAKELAQYLDPRLKAMDLEVSGNPDRPLVFQLEESLMSGLQRAEQLRNGHRLTSDHTA